MGSKAEALQLMQPYTPHGDSNPEVQRMNLDINRCNLIPLTGTVTSRLLVGSGMVGMQPYTPHGDSNFSDFGFHGLQQGMQPYTPHGDSNRQGAQRYDINHDATLYPSRGQ